MNSPSIVSTPPEFIIVVGASAGGIHALSQLVQALPTDMAAAMVIVQHLETTENKSRLPDILRRYTPLTVSQVQDNQVIYPGSIYVAQPGKHVRIKNKTLFLDMGKPVRFVRPSADVLFISAAKDFLDRCIGVILTGTGSDGAKGCMEIKAAGGTCMAQDKNTALFFDMPEAAIATGAVDHVLPIEKMAAQIVEVLHIKNQKK